jgi:hypothetical protein
MNSNSRVLPPDSWLLLGLCVGFFLLCYVVYGITRGAVRGWGFGEMGLGTTKTKADNPMLFWFHVFAYLFLGGALVIGSVLGITGWHY